MLHTTSSLQTWRSCKRLYRYRYVDLVRQAVSGQALRSGTAVHAGLEAFLDGGDVVAMLAAADFETLKPEWGDDAGKVERARVRAMLRAYHARWADTRANWERVEVEKSFSFDLRDGRTALGQIGGKRDGMMRRLDTGLLYVVEHKTTSDEIATAADDYWRRLDVDLQITLYRGAAEREYGEPVGVLYDVLRKPMGSPKLKSGVVRRKDETDEALAARKAAARETLDEFEERMLQTMLDAPDEYLVRREVVRTAEQTAELLDELRETVREVAKYAGCYPRNDGACRSRFGACAYLGVCSGTETLDSERFIKIETTHPELDHHNNGGETNGKYDDCPI